MDPTFWFNGLPTDRVPASARGLHYGDGHFTTMRIAGGMCPSWSAHRQRLELACQRLFMTAPEWAAIERCLSDQVAGLDGAVAKLIILRGQGGRGYSPTGCHASDWLLGLYPLPANLGQRQRHGIRVGHCQTPLARNPSLAGIKHLNRLEQVLARREVDQQGWDEGLVCDTAGYLVEATSANLFWYHDAHWQTPALHYCGVAGIMRQKLCHYLAQDGRPVQEGYWSPGALSRADAVVLCNSVQGIVPVRELSGRSLSLEPALQLQAGLIEHSGEALAC